MPNSPYTHHRASRFPLIIWRQKNEYPYAQAVISSPDIIHRVPGSIHARTDRASHSTHRIVMGSGKYRYIGTYKVYGFRRAFRSGCRYGILPAAWHIAHHFTKEASLRAYRTQYADDWRYRLQFHHVVHHGSALPFLAGIPCEFQFHCSRLSRIYA